MRLHATQEKPAVKRERSRKTNFLLFTIFVLTGCGGGNFKPAAPSTPATTAAARTAVVFLGDSITAQWNLDQSFPNQGYINKGIGGQTAVMIADRFAADVAPLNPKAVLILAGTNDIYGGATAAQVENTLALLYQRTRDIGGTPIACTIPPMRAQDAVHNPVILEVNNWIRTQKLVADYYSVLVDSNGELNVLYVITNNTTGLPDTVHPNAQGYALMTPQAQKALQ